MMYCLGNIYGYRFRFFDKTLTIYAFLIQLPKFKITKISLFYKFTINEYRFMCTVFNLKTLPLSDQ